MNNMPIMDDILKIDNVSRFFGDGEGRIDVLKDASFAMKKGEIIALVAPSGTGKSTLLHLAGLLEKPDSGNVVIAGKDCGALPDAERTAVRRSDIGFVYQFHHLLPEFSAIENVMMPQMIAGKSRTGARPRAVQLLERVGLKDRLEHRPGKLSGGEQQRVAIARALANEPRIVLADEPTGNLDLHTADDVFAMLATLVRDFKVAALIATHNLEIAQRMDRVVTIKDGVLQAA